MATKNVSSKNVNVKNVSTKNTVRIMAANEYSLAILTDLPSAVNYGATVYAGATAYAHTFNVPWSISAIDITSFAAVTTGTHLSYATSGTVLPAQITWDGESVNTTQFNFNIAITNLDGDSFPTSIDEIVAFTMASSGILSAGATGTVHDATSQTADSTIYAQGSALSALYSFAIVVSTYPTTIPANSTVYTPVTAYAHTFQPIWNGLSSLNVGSFSISSNTSRLTYAVSASQSFPAELTWNGVATPKFVFNVGITNPNGNADDIGAFTVTGYTSGKALSASGGIRVLQPSTAATSTASNIRGLGLPASGITNFTLIPQTDFMGLTWSNPVADFVAAKVNRSLTTAITLSSDGELIYSGTGTSYNDTSSVGLSGFYYGIYAVDTDGNSSSVSSASAIGIIAQNYPSSSDASLNVLDPLSPFNETKFSRLCRLGEEDLI